MKIISPVALAIMLVSAGCLQVPQETAQRLAHSRRLFNEVKTGMTKEDLISALGQPQREDSRVCYWETSYGQMNRESLETEFDAGGKVVRIKLNHLEVNQPPVPTIGDEAKVQPVRQSARPTNG